MSETTKKNSCFKEYTNRNYVITNVSLQTKLPKETISYFTTHSAFIFPLEGKAMVSFDGKTFLARPGYIVHGAPSHQLSFEVLGESPFVHLNIYYDADELWKEDSDWMHTLYAVSIKENRYADQLLQELSQNCHVRNWDELLQREVLAKQLILRLFSHASGSDADYRIGLAAEYIRQNLHKRLTLGELAERCGMEETRFSYLFSRIYHIRPIDYLIRLRLKRASELLSRGMSVAEAAEQVGYQDALYFSRLFKKHYGFAPSRLKNGTGTGKEHHVSEENSGIVLL